MYPLIFEFYEIMFTLSEHTENVWISLYSPATQYCYMYMNTENTRVWGMHVEALCIVIQTTAKIILN